MRTLLAIARHAAATALFVGYVFGPLIVLGLLDRAGLLPPPGDDWRG